MNRAERDRMVLDNLPLVGYLASEVASKMTDLSRDDLASAGSLALLKSAEAYDPSLGVPFGAFARRRILGAFQDEMRSEDWATRTARARIKESVSVSAALSESLGRAPSVGEVAAAMGVGEQQAATAMSDAVRSVSPLDEHAAEMLVSSNKTPEEALMQAEQEMFLNSCVDALPDRIRDVVRAVYLDGLPVKEVAEQMGTTHSAVSQQRAEGIRMLREAMTAHYSAPGHAAAAITAQTPRRVAYLADVAERTVGGITRFVRAPHSVAEMA